MKPGRTYTVSMMLALLLTALPCLAHTGIARTVPDHDAVIDRAPTLLHFSFDGQVTITNARLLPVDTKGIQTGKSIPVQLPRNRIGQSTAFGEEIDLDIPELPPGVYKVVFQVVTIDGHTLADDFTFSLIPGSPDQ